MIHNVKYLNPTYIQYIFIDNADKYVKNNIINNGIHRLKGAFRILLFGRLLFIQLPYMNHYQDTKKLRYEKSFQAHFFSLAELFCKLLLS